MIHDHHERYLNNYVTSQNFLAEILDRSSPYLRKISDLKSRTGNLIEAWNKTLNLLETSSDHTIP